MTYHQPNDNGFYGRFGGRFVPETLMTAVLELDQAYRECKADPSFQAEFKQLLKTYVGRETPLYFAENLTAYCGGAKIYLKREDLNHTGAHKINNVKHQNNHRTDYQGQGQISFAVFYFISHRGGNNPAVK